MIAATGGLVNQSAAADFTDRLGPIPASSDLPDALEDIATVTIEPCFR